MNEKRIDRIPARAGRASRWTVIAATAAAVVLAAANARAQTPACDQLKTSLAARLPAPGSYHLESLPAGEPVPKGAKVIGNCSGGAYRMLFIRGAAPATAAPAPKPAPVEKAAVVAPAPAPAPAAVVPPPPAPAPEPVAVVVVVPPPKPEPKPEPAPEPRPIVKPVAEAEADTAELMPMPAPADEGPSFLDEATGFAGEHWPWLSALIALPLLLWGWGRVSHYRAYDAAGLPRGPRL
jgi:hypothetical protein